MILGNGESGSLVPNTNQTIRCPIGCSTCIVNSSSINCIATSEGYTFV